VTKPAAALMICACCLPALEPPCVTCAVPTGACHIRLTARLLSGAVLAKVTAGPGTRVGELWRSIEVAAMLPEGRVVRWLAWGSRELRDDELLRDVGVSGAEDLLAICADAMVGDFEVYVPGCPTCDFGGDLQRVCFHEDGTALIHSGPNEAATKYRYTLGDLSGNTRQLRFVEDATASSKVYSGILEVSATNHINRRVKIPKLDIDVQDVRYHEEQGRSYLQMKMRMLVDFHGGQLDSTTAAFWSQRDLNSISDEAEVWEAAARAWSLWKQDHEDEEDMELCDFHNRSLEAKRGKPGNPTNSPQNRGGCYRSRVWS